MKDYETHGHVAVVKLDNPPVNGLALELRQAIVASVEAAQKDAAIKAVVLIGAGRVFSGGADIKEFTSDKVYAEPEMSTVIRTLEASTKPVIAAIAGVAMGGGLELALGCHYRVVAAGAQLALPEVNLGLLPGAGGTQRLPRLLGVEKAVEMITSGGAVVSDKLKDTPLIDCFVTGDLLPAALDFANKVADQRPLPRVRDIKIDFPNTESYFAAMRKTVAQQAKRFVAPSQCLEAVYAAATQPFDQGLATERELFKKLLATPESRAQRHAFFAERACAKILDVPDNTLTRKIERVAVIGAGTMGGGITMVFLNAGIPVTMLEAKADALERGVATIRKNYENTMKKGKLTQAALDQRMALLSTTMKFADVANADMVIEAVFEEMSVKEAVFKQLDSIMKPGAILATNTSTLDVDKIASFTKRPQDVLGTHFFSPANVMRLLEVVRGAATAKDVLATIMQLAKKIKKVAVVSRVCDGFIGNRMLEHYVRVAGFLLEDGATPQQVDRALENWGMAMGPFRMGDLAGNDISWAIRKRRYIEKPEVKYPKIADRLCEKGRYGQKTGKGWYRYEAGSRDAIPDPEVEQMIADYRQENGITPSQITDAEIVERCIFALVNEAARLLEEGIAQRASDVDMVYLAGYGFPAHRGGPLLYADEVGLKNVAASMRKFAAASGDQFWQPAPLIEKLIAQGKTFN